MTPCENDQRKQREPASEQQLRALLRLKARATARIWIVTILITEFLAAIFSVVAQTVSEGETNLPVMIFTCATSLLVVRWLQQDAYRAWISARTNGYLKRDASGDYSVVDVRPDCPRRWLVLLHAQLNVQLPPRVGERSR
ncbi:hypothetical protein [Paraburkholderia kirstenboschensis]|uniref:Uncharacterized protein n=1 Tax=Paraburkholderia kirstenboschensis TaxID=1245436 RepID=A0ABZ0EF90_9BURK|nr:hypothetical protein [Paraburkholderia kirstenboschensis]WOD15895.1 hypothetical protein RW095_21945 [Paraburkholderia kirstenboschensis]